MKANNQSNFLYYTCDAAGIKLRKTAGSTTTDYVGNFVYENNLLKYIITDYGKPRIIILKKILNTEQGTSNFEVSSE